MNKYIDIPSGALECYMHHNFDEIIFLLFPKEKGETKRIYVGPGKYNLKSLLQNKIELEQISEEMFWQKLTRLQGGEPVEKYSFNTFNQ